MRAALLVLALGLLGDDAVDPALVGTWQTVIKNDQGEWTLTFQLEASGAYRTAIKGPAALPDETGKFTAADGKWATAKSNGQKDAGTYALNGETLTFTSPGGTLVWKRLAPAAKPPAKAEPDPAAAPLIGVGAANGRIVPERPAEPVALPKGRLDFIQGLDLLGQGQFVKSAEAFQRATATDEENSDYVGLHGAALVLAEQVRDGMALLDRSMRLNPRNLNASRMMGFAYRMQGDQITAAKFHGHGSLQDIDRLMVDVGNTFARSAKAGGADQVRGKLALVGSTLAALYRTGDKSSLQAEYAIGVAAVRNREFARALPLFRHVLAAYPFDWSSVHYHAWCALETGNAETARGHFTTALSYLPALPEAYAGRALCAARQGDADRVRRDLAVLAELDPDRARAIEAETRAALAEAAAASAADPQALWGRLRAAADAAEFEDLVKTALDLRRAMNARRLRYDERVQDGLRERTYALRLAPRNPDRMVDLADYLHAHRDVPALQVSGGNGPVHSFRYLPTALKDQEATFGQSLCNQALQMDPKHARAMVRKAAILLNYTPLPDYSKLSHPYGGTPDTEAFPSGNFGFDRLREIEKLCLQAVQIDGKIAEAYDLLSDCTREYAAWQRHQAFVLRHPVQWTRVVSSTTGAFLRYDWSYRTPTAEEVAQAEALERQAAENEKRRSAAWSKMSEASRGTPRESYYVALEARLRGDDATARATMERGVQAHPNDPVLCRNYAETLRRLGQETDYIEAYDRYIALLETSAEVWLKVVWEKIQRNAWKAAEAALDRAAQKDPADPRVAAYRGVFAETQNRWPEAVAWYRVALALDEARARLNGTTFGEKPPSGPEFRFPDDFGLTWAVRLKAGRALFFSDPAKAASYYLLNIANEARLNEWQFSDSATTAMLPDPRQDPKGVPDPPMTATVLMESRRLAGQCLVRSGKPAEGLQQLGAAETYKSRLPGGGTAYLDIGVGAPYMPYPGSSAELWSKLTSARALLDQGKTGAAKGQLEAVRRALTEHPSPSDPAVAEYNKLAPKVGLSMTREGAEPAKADPAKVDAGIVSGWKCTVERQGKSVALTYQFAATGDYTLTIQPLPGTQPSVVHGTFEAVSGRLKLTNANGKTEEGTYKVDGRELLMDFSGQKLKLERH